MTERYPTRLQIKSANSIARNLARIAVDGRREDTRRFYLAAAEMMDAAGDVGVSRDFLHDVAKGLHAEMTKFNASMRSDLDDVGCASEWQPIDLTDLDELLENLS